MMTLVDEVLPSVVQIDVCSSRDLRVGCVYHVGKDLRPVLVLVDGLLWLDTAQFKIVSSVILFDRVYGPFDFTLTVHDYEELGRTL